MTIDQTLHLLAVLAWPTVAVVGLFAAYRLAAAIEFSANRLGQVSHDKTLDTTRWLQLASSVLQSTLPATIRTVTSKSRDDLLRETCERALLTILGTNGGFPAAPGDHVARQIVREIREMYAELEKPTKPPERKHPEATSPSESFDFSAIDEFEMSAAEEELE